MSERYMVTRLEDVVAFAGPERASWRPIRAELGVTAFGVNAWKAAEAGQELIGEHVEGSGHEELYVVLAGRATFTVGGETIDAPTGQLVFVAPEVKRAATAAETGTIVLVVGGKRGEAFSVSPWERFAKGLQFFATGEYVRAREFFEEANRETPDEAVVLYNLACAESHVGRSDDALAHLEQAIALRGSFREAAQTDSDFDAIRSDPRFPQPD